MLRRRDITVAGVRFPHHPPMRAWLNGRVSGFHPEDDGVRFPRLAPFPAVAWDKGYRSFTARLRRWDSGRRDQNYSRIAWLVRVPAFEAGTSPVRILLREPISRRSSAAEWRNHNPQVVRSTRTAGTIHSWFSSTGQSARLWTARLRFDSSSQDHARIAQRKSIGLQNR